MTGRSRRIVLSYGCFDQFDPQDATFLRSAMDLGDELIIGCATDACAELQGTPCLASFEHRKEMLEHCRYVDRVITLHDPEQMRTDVVNYNVSILVIGPEGFGAQENVQDIAQTRDLSNDVIEKPSLLRVG